jgi:hypothetical protein
VIRLDASLQQLREISAKHQAEIVAKHSSINLKTQFQADDLVQKSVRTPTKHWKPKKIGPPFYGPTEVTRVDSNDYTYRDVTDATGNVCHTNLLKLYFGTMAMAKQAALLNHDQYFVS